MDAFSLAGMKGSFMTGYNEKVNVGILDYVWIEV
jgi:hypothetical protein